MRRSLSSMWTSTSSASGSTATVAAEVWMRPPLSVTGTRWTRWTPLSNFNRANTPWPETDAITSLKPPISDALLDHHAERFELGPKPAQFARRRRDRLDLGIFLGEPDELVRREVGRR